MNKSRLKIGKNEIGTLLCIGILFLNSWALNMKGNTIGTEFERNCINYIMWLFFLMLVLFWPLKKRISILEMTMALSCVVHRLFYYFYPYNGDGILGLSAIAFCVLYCFFDDERRASVFRCFKYILVAESAIGIICFASYLLQLGIPYTLAYRADGVFYVNYHLCYLMSTYDVVIRFCGLFDEPGFFGTFAAFFLCADGLNFKKKENVILLIGGLLSLSLAFVLMLILYYIMKNVYKWKKWIYIVVVGISFLFLLPNLQTENPYLDTLVERMTIDDEGLKGDNRTGRLFQAVWERAINDDMIYSGYGAGYAEYFGTSETEGIASIKSYVVNFGIIGTLIIFIPVFITAIRQSFILKNNDIILYTLITYISLYQRPCLFVPAYFIVFLCGISYITMNKKERYINNE